MHDERRKDDPEKMARMRAWLDLVEAETGVGPEALADLQAPVLDLISTVAHGPSRPGAPLTAFLVGIAVGRGADGAELVSRLARLAESQPAQE